MEAPKKIYLFENPIDGIPDYRWLSKRSCNDDVEYTRTDVLITEVIEWLYQRQAVDLEVSDTEKFIEDFKKAMEGE